MYSKYVEFIKNISIDNIDNFNFKNNTFYNSILEHVTNEQGQEYLNLIKENFSYITKEQILEYLNINDKYGFPKKVTFKFKDEQDIIGSATSIRYIYHALLILSYYEKTNLSEMVEVGCGYGGLFLAICFFSNNFNVKINKYFFVDLPEVCNLIQCYLKINNKHINIDYQIHYSDTFGNNIIENNLFFISNYCFTEIDTVLREEYIKYLIPKCKQGFIIWQTIFGYEIEKSHKLFEIKSIIEETPQTSNNTHKNYFVYF